MKRTFEQEIRHSETQGRRRRRLIFVKVTLVRCPTVLGISAPLRGFSKITIEIIDRGALSPRRGRGFNILKTNRRVKKMNNAKTALLAFRQAIILHLKKRHIDDDDDDTTEKLARLDDRLEYLGLYVPQYTAFI